MLNDEDEYPERSDIELGQVLSALADPLRRRVISTLAGLPPDAERTCASFNLPVSKASVTHHFRVLRHAGLIRQIDRGNSRAAVLRRSDLEQRFPGLLAILVAEENQS